MERENVKKRKRKNKRKNKKRKKERVVLFVSFPFHSLPFSSPFALRPLFFLMSRMFIFDAPSSDHFIYVRLYNT